MRQHRTSSSLRSIRALIAGLGALALTGTVPGATAAERVVIALDPPSAETNLFWHTIGDLGLDPSHQRVVGTDAVTGEYDDSGLARAWEVSDDFRQWTFHLHEDAQFHFGWGPVTAADVVHSYELHIAPDSTIVVSNLRADEVEAVDDHTVVFRFEQPRTDYAFGLAGPDAMYVYSKAQYDAEGLDGYRTRPAGTGPYRYVERRMGEGVLFERVDDHWQGIEPDFRELEMRWAPEAATKLALLLAGEADISYLPREIQADALAQGKKIIGSRNPSMQTVVIFNGLYMQTGDPAYDPDLPWVDVRIREAMNRAVDREQLIEILYDGRAETLVRYGMDPRHEGYVPELEERFEAEYGYDPERAKELLAEAGYPDAFTDPTIPIVSTVLAGNPEFPTLAELLQVYFEEVGFQTEIREMDFAALGALGRGREAYVISPIRNAPIRPTAVHLNNSYTSEGSSYHGYEDDRIQALIDELNALADPEERDRIAREAFTHLFEQYSDLPLAAVSAEVMVDPEVVVDWMFPGVASIGLSHWHAIEAAR